MISEIHMIILSLQGRKQILNLELYEEAWGNIRLLCVLLKFGEISFFHPYLFTVGGFQAIYR